MADSAVPSGGGGAAAQGSRAQAASAGPSAADVAANQDSTARDALYSFKETELDAVRAAKPWATNAKYFKKVKISPSAAMKMLMHANSGVDKGIKKGGKPVEVMGMLLGRPDTQAGCLVVTDVFPLPIEGAETKVLADDEEVTNYMIELGESLEATRKERFMGWYHSHPFDVEAHSHCFLSSTDLSTQLAWQRAEDPHGNPWLAIVVDPLRSLAKGYPEFGAFRAYPPEYTAPENETPDGQIVFDDTQRIERWGTCWNRYCCLEIEYFMSSLASNVMGTLTENFLWMRTLSSTPMLDRENRERFSERISAVGEKLTQSSDYGVSRSSMFSMDSAALSSSAAAAAGQSGSSSSGGASSKEESVLKKAANTACEFAIEHCQGQCGQLIKDAVFNLRRGASSVKEQAPLSSTADTNGTAAASASNGTSSSSSSSVPVVAMET